MIRYGYISNSSESRALGLNLRYFIVNLGAGMGPLIGFYFKITINQAAFFVTSIFFLINFFLIYFLNFNKIKIKNLEKKSISFSCFFNILYCDHAFLILIVSNILLWIVFMQFEAIIPLYFSTLNIYDVSKLISLIFLTNTITILLFQFPISNIMRNFDLKHKIYVSIIILSISQLSFAYSASNFYFWIISTVLFSIGEVIIIPSLNVAIDQMAPDNLRGSYFAVSSLYKIGCGAYLGGLILQVFGERILYWNMCFICLIIGVLYSFSLKIKNKRSYLEG